MENRFAELAGKLPSSSFAFTMSTGIVSISALLHNMLPLSYALFILGFLMLLSLGFLYLTKIALKPGAARVELWSNSTFFGLFTISAGIGVISSRLMVSYTQSYDYLLSGFSMCLLLSFLLLFGAHVARGRIRLRNDSVTSDWLNIPVALEASVISASIYYEHTSPAPAGIYLFLFALLSAGLVSYILINISEVRNLLRSGVRRKFTGMFFVNMGAAAIFSLASFELLRVSSPIASGAIQSSLKLFFLAGGVYATIWLPVVAYRYLRVAFASRKVEYRVSQWAIIFPLGMFSVATRYLSDTYSFHGIFLGLSYVIFMVALAAWMVEIAIAAYGISGILRGGKK